MAEINKGRFTAELDKPVVLFLIGMRINRLRAVGKWLPVARAMPRMLEELERHPGSGLLAHRTYVSWREVMVVQYWESFDKLTDYAHQRDAEHFPAWTAFNRSVGQNGLVGIWHETYHIKNGGFECVYGNMPTHGLAAAARRVPATGRLAGAKSRMELADD